MCKRSVPFKEATLIAKERGTCETCLETVFNIDFHRDP